MKVKLIIISLLFLFLGCFSVDDALKWVDQNEGKTNIDINGVWENKDWGDCIIKQEGSKISGTLGEWKFTGSINDKEVFLVISHRGFLDYIMKFTLQKDMLVGKYGSGIKDEDWEKAYPIILKRKK